MNEVLLIIAAYLIGSIPTAVWVSKYFFDIDIRDYGSGNSGATNTYRVLGSRWGTFVMIVDMVKGVIATSLYILLPYYLSKDPTIGTEPTLMIGLRFICSCRPYFSSLGKLSRRQRRCNFVWNDSRHSTFSCRLLCWRVFAICFIFNEICFIEFYFIKHCICHFYTFYF